MTKIIRIGMDTSKSVFVLHGVDAAERPVLRKKLRRGQVLEFFAKLDPTKIGLEACGGAHYWARELHALGHEVVLLPPQYVKPYVKRNKNDAADAEAICEAMSRPTMRFVPVKTAEQQAALMLAGMRDQLIRRRTQVSNAIRGYAAEFGLTAAKGLSKIEPLLARVAAHAALPELARELFAGFGREYGELQVQIAKIEAQLMAWHKSNELSRRMAEIPAIGPIGASLLAMKVTDPQAFRSGRDFAAWLGFTPQDHSTAGKTRLGVITRAGDDALRSVLVAGATAVIQQVKRGRGHSSPWLVELVKRKPPKLAAVALANKTARVAWKLMVSGEHYDRARNFGRSKRRSWTASSAVLRYVGAPRSAPRCGCTPPPAAAMAQATTSSARVRLSPHAEAAACLRWSRWRDRSIPDAGHSVGPSGA
jgi:transposase